MPVIPGPQESQVLNAGSPVPIASPEEARLSGNALSRLGEGAFALGDALDTAATKERQTKDRLSAQIAENEAMKVILEEKAASQQAGPIAGDVTGFGQSKAFYDRVQPRINEIADRIDNPETKRMFLAGIGPETNRSATEVYAQEIVKRKNQNLVMQDAVISGYGQIARMNPKETDFMLKQTELSVRTNPDIQPAVMEEAVAEAKKKVLIDAINGQTSRKNYASAEVMLEKLGGGLLDPKEKDKMLDDIRTTQDKDYNREIMALTREEKQHEKQKQQVEKDKMNFYFSALQLAGVSEQKRAPIVNQIGQDVIKGNISEEKAKALIGSKVFAAPTDDLYDVTIMRQVFKDENYKEMIDKVYADRGIKVSPERASDMVNRIGAIQDRQRNDPTFTALIRAGEKKIKDQASDTILAPLDNATKRELLTKVNQTVEQYYKQVMNNPKANTAAIADNLISTNLGFRTNFLKGQENFFNYNSQDGLAKERDRIVKDTMDKKRKGILTPEQERAAKRNLQMIQKRIQEIKPVEGAQPSVTPTGTATTNAPVRGR